MTVATYRFRVAIAAAAGILLLTLVAGTAPAAAQRSGGEGGCSVKYRLTSDTANRYQAKVTVTNRGPAKEFWRVGFRLPKGHQAVDSSGSTKLEQRGQWVVIKGANPATSLRRGASRSTTVVVKGSRAPRKIDNFKLNGDSCGRGSGGGAAANPGRTRSNKKGFSVKNGNLIDANGRKFVVRASTHMHAWYRDKLWAMDDIAATGANAVRVVITAGRQSDWPLIPESEIRQVVSRCKANELICILSLHDTHGLGDRPQDAITLTEAAAYWKSVKGALVGQEEYVIINLGNEPRGNVDVEKWVGETKQGLKAMRRAGFKHTILLDGPNWGQDNKGVMLRNAKDVFRTDPNRNVVFAVHMYGHYPNAKAVNGYLDAFKKTGMPLIIGEFGDSHFGSPVDQGAIMEQGAKRDIGWIAWSWSGNGSATANLDMVRNFDPNNLTEWGREVIHGKHGLAKTSKRASVFR